jgi:hypothetical protein
MMPSSPARSPDRCIVLIRGQRVMLDADLAVLYGVSTRMLNQGVKRNGERFPEDFMFRLTVTEKAGVITNCDHLRPLQFSPSLAYAFTEHGAIMLAEQRCPVLSQRIAEADHGRRKRGAY